jgi:hypothetical protein
MSSRTPKIALATTLILFSYISSSFAANIQITEIFPNPKGKDSDQEWIELYNPQNNTINLKDWTLNKKKLPKVSIKAQSYLLLKGRKLPITLKNNNTQIILQDQNGKTISTVEYIKSIEAQSYSKVQIRRNQLQKNTWAWTIPSPETVNPQYEIIQSRKIDEMNTSRIENDLLLQTLLKNTPLGRLLVQKGNPPEIIKLEIINQKPRTKQPLETNWHFYLLTICCSTLLIFYKLPIALSTITANSPRVRGLPGSKVSPETKPLSRAATATPRNQSPAIFTSSNGETSTSTLSGTK